jgi:hypothetical protein
MLQNIQTTLHYLNRKLMFTAGGCFDVHLPLITSVKNVFYTEFI